MGTSIRTHWPILAEYTQTALRTAVAIDRAIYLLSEQPLHKTSILLFHHTFPVHQIGLDYSRSTTCVLDPIETREWLSAEYPVPDQRSTIDKSYFWSCSSSPACKSATQSP